MWPLPWYNYLLTTIFRFVIECISYFLPLHSPHFSSLNKPFSRPQFFSLTYTQTWYTVWMCNSINSLQDGHWPPSPCQSQLAVIHGHFLSFLHNQDDLEKTGTPHVSVLVYCILVCLQISHHEVLMATKLRDTITYQEVSNNGSTHEANAAHHGDESHSSDASFCGK